MNQSNKFIFSKEKAPKTPLDTSSKDFWKVAVIDDDEQIHEITHIVLNTFSFDGKKIKFLYAKSAKEGLQLFKQHDDIAVCLLDVVMETEHAGLKLVKSIREDLKNAFTRIVLRTGQPGQAPEEDVISNYDINDYKEKTELTRSKLTTLMYSCLRSYRDIIALDKTRKGLEQVICSTSQLSNFQFIEEFSKGILQQVTSILNFGESAFYGIGNGLAAHGGASEKHENIRIVAGIGQYENQVSQKISEVIPVKLIDLLKQHNEVFYSSHTDDAYLACHNSEGLPKNVLYFKGMRKRDALQQKLLDIYSRNVLVSFENICLKCEAEETQQEIVYMLGEAVESRSYETGNHLKRVAQVTQILALKLKLNSKHVELIVQASPLHDLGKIGIPDHILHKPGKFDDQEWEIMKTHVNIGYDMMKHSQNKVFQVGALIALDHHERWDGKGYPSSKKEAQISIEGRIVAIADVLDALASKRCYKEPWKIDDIFQYLNENSGTQFDPTLIKLLMEEEKEIRAMYNDFER